MIVRSSGDGERSGNIGKIWCCVEEAIWTQMVMKIWMPSLSALVVMIHFVMY